MLQGVRLALWKHRGTWDPDSGSFQVRYNTGGGTASAKGGLGSALRGGAALHQSQLQGEEEGTGGGRACQISQSTDLLSMPALPSVTTIGLLLF